MNNYLALSLATIIVIINGLIGHFFAPNGIILTPIVLIITTFLVVYGTKNIDIKLIPLLTYFYVALNDISIKLFSGGSHDNEGLDWIHFFLFIGLVPTLGILLTGIFRRNVENLANKFFATGLFIVLIAIHLHLFIDLGLGRYYSYD